MFHCNTKEEADKFLNTLDCTWVWHDNGDLTIYTCKLPGVKVSSNGRKAFMNNSIAGNKGVYDERNP